jgi:lysophospholipid acyltransferase (LPLAT)-like uncharacterized protein
MKPKILGFIAFLIIRIIGMTMNYRLHFKNKEDEEYFRKCFNAKKPDKDGQYLLAFFHQDELCVMNYFRKQRMSVLVSISKDGEIMNNTANFLGYSPVRGSSSKKAISGLIAAIRKVKDGYNMAFAVDGPRGPIYKVKDGICAISKKTNVKIIPMRAYASKQHIFEKSWNKAKFPKPFTNMDIFIGTPAVYETQDLENELLSLVNTAK